MKCELTIESLLTYGAASDRLPSRSGEACMKHVRHLPLKVVGCLLSGQISQTHLYARSSPACDVLGSSSAGGCMPLRKGLTTYLKFMSYV